MDLGSNMCNDSSKAVDIISLIRFISTCYAVASKISSQKADFDVYLAHWNRRKSEPVGSRVNRRDILELWTGPQEIGYHKIVFNGNSEKRV